MPLDPSYPFALIQHPDGRVVDLGDRFNSPPYDPPIDEIPEDKAPKDKKAIAIKLALKQAKSDRS